MNVDDLPTLPLTIHVKGGTITTGHPTEDERLARAIVSLEEVARKSGKMWYVYEHPKHGLTASIAPPKRWNYIEVFPGGRTVLRHARKLTKGGDR